ncbi:DUF4292 domain-containing protein [Rubrivirga sp.]|uniref:DUF4292 domain-containing protein n=1 Tax=Rubrivirga sp. TaxID=1885344 RepID=UPI003B529765
MLRPALAALGLLLIAGCGPTGPLVRDAPEGPAAGYPNHSVGTIVESVAASVAPILSVAADGDVRIDQDGSDQSATFSLRTRLGDSTTVVVRGPLGITAGRGLVTADSVFLANALQDELVIGPLSAADAIVPGASRDGRVVRAALGLLVPEADVAWSLTAQDGTYQLTGRLSDASSRAYTVDPSVWRVVRVVEFGPDGRQVGVQTAEAFDTVDGAVLPRRIRLEGAGTVVELEHRRLAVNPPDLRLRFSRPEGYQVIEIR